MPKTLSKKNGGNDFLFLLTNLERDADSEIETEKELDCILDEMGYDKPSLVYYVSKEKLLAGKYDKVAQNLAYGFIRKLYFQIINEYCNCLLECCNNSVTRLHEIKREVLSYIFSHEVETNGESCFDFFARLVQIYHNDEYNKSIIERRLRISKLIYHFRELNELNKKINISKSDKEWPNILAIRETELYDKHINKKHCEISTGDIFKIKNDYYILATQSCDTFLRKNGTRKLTNCATLHKIVNNCSEKYKCTLSYFKDDDVIMENPSVIYRDSIFIPFEILDLCAADDRGCASISLTNLNSNCDLDETFTSNYKNRYNQIKQKLRSVYENMSIVQNHINNSENDIEKVRLAYEMLIQIDAFLKDYTVRNEIMLYDVRRVSRLNELYTISMLNNYVSTLSRVGEPSDFTK